MPKRDRKDLILSFLDRHNLTLPPAAIYYNLERPTFTEVTAKRLLLEMLDEGLVEQPDDKPGYYRITEDGLAALKERDET